jgi:hypothetical protein
VLADRLIADVIERSAQNGLSPVQRVAALGDALTDVGRQALERDLIEMIHRPDNRAVHDSMSQQVMSRLTPTLTSVIREGIDAGVFRR